MSQLSPVTKDQAEKFLSECSFDDHIIGLAMSASAGNNEEHIYSYKELFRFLRPITLEELSQRGHATMSYIEPNTIINWVGGTYGDKELADAMVVEFEKYNSLAEKLTAARGLLKERIDQCEEIINKK